MINDDCVTCCTARKNTLSHLFFSRIGPHVAVDHPHTPVFQRIGTTLRADAKLTFQIPPRRPFVWFPAYTGIDCPDVTSHDRFSPVYSPRRRWQCRPGSESRARNTSVPSVCQGLYAGWNRTQPMTYNQFTCRDVTSLSVSGKNLKRDRNCILHFFLDKKVMLTTVEWKKKAYKTFTSKCWPKIRSFCDDVLGESTCQHKFRTFYHANHVARTQVLSPRLFLEYFLYDRFDWFR